MLELEHGARGGDDGVSPGDDPGRGVQRLLSQLHILDDLLLDLLDLLVWVTVSGILTVLGDEVQHRQPPVQDAHEPHVVQEDGEPGDILGGFVVNLGLEDRVRLLDLHWLESDSHHVQQTLGLVTRDKLHSSSPCLTFLTFGPLTSRRILTSGITWSRSGPVTHLDQAQEAHPSLPLESARALHSSSSFMSLLSLVASLGFDSNFQQVSRPPMSSSDRDLMFT